MNLDVNKQILDVIIKAKSKLTRTVNVKDNHSKVLSKFVPKLKVSDRISNSNSPYTNDNQCNNIAYLAPSRNKIQLSICNQRKVINNPLVVDNNISTCRLTLSNERTSFNFNMIVPSGVDLQKEKRNSHPIKNMALTQKEKDASLNIRSNIMISNHNTIISIPLRKKLNNDLLPNNDTNPIKANSHNTITKNINTNNVSNKQHVQKQIYHQQLLLTTIAEQISKKAHITFPSYIVRSRYYEQDQFINNIRYVRDDTVSTLTNISPSSSFLSSFSDDGLSTETCCKTYISPTSLQLKVCLIASTYNTISQDIEVPILICPSNASSNIALYLGLAMITHNHPYHPIFLYFISPKKVHPCLNDVSDHSNSSTTITTKYATFTNILKGFVETYNTQTIPNTTGSQFEKKIHHHLSHRHYLRDH